MKIAVINMTIKGENVSQTQVFLPGILKGLADRGSEVHLITDSGFGDGFRRQFEGSAVIVHPDLWNEKDFIEETAPVLTAWLNAEKPDIYLIAASNDVGWSVLPQLEPQIAALTIGDTDAEFFYIPVRHYRMFLTRLIGTTPEVCVGYVLNCVIEKEKVEWISYDAQESGDGLTDEQNMHKIVEHFEECFTKARSEAKMTPRLNYPDYPLLPAARSFSPLWLRKLKAKITG